MSLYVSVDEPHELEWLSDGIVRIVKWNDGRIAGYVSNLKKTKWHFAREFSDWDAASEWWRTGHDKDLHIREQGEKIS